MRPGEKLYEELRHTEESHEPTEHPRIFKLKASHASSETDAWIARIAALTTTADNKAMKTEMSQIVPEYRPTFD